MKSVGLNRKIFEKQFLSDADDIQVSVSNELQGVLFEHIYLICIILLCGYFVALIVFMFELIINKK